MDAEAAVVPPHQPVLYHEIIQLLAPASPHHYLDCTAGAGGHASGILQFSAPHGELIALDLDPLAVNITKQTLQRFGNRAHVFHGSYRESERFLDMLGWDKLDGIVLDLGVSSMQLDQPDRGFSFKNEGPLDMRFDQTSGETAADLVNNLQESELADLIWKYGEERYARRIARAIVRERPLETTQALATVVRSAIPGSRERQDPATRTFQALRIAVNQELANIENALPELIKLLGAAGRIAVISFHSLEDRLVKRAFQRESRDCICPPEQLICTCNHHASIKLLTPHPLVAGEAEKRQNPRSRSAKLRVAQKI